MLEEATLNNENSEEVKIDGERLINIVITDEFGCRVVVHGHLGEHYFHDEVEITQRDFYFIGKAMGWI